MAKRRFYSERKAKSFAEAVNGQFKDLRDIEGAISDFVVTYDGSSKNQAKKNRNRELDNSNDWAPEEGRDFGYSNEYWN